MRLRMVLLLPAVLLAASCGSLIQAPTGTPQFTDAVYKRPERPQRTVPIYSKEDFEKMARTNGKFVPDSLPLENSGWSYTYTWQAPDYWHSYAFGPSYWGCNPYWYGRTYLGGWYRPWSHWGVSMYYDWYRPYSPWGFYDPWYSPYGFYGPYYAYGWGYDPWFYDPWYYGGYSYYHARPHHDYGYGGGHGYGRDNSYVPRSFVQGNGRSDSGVRTPGTYRSAVQSSSGMVTRSRTSAPGVTPRGESQTTTGYRRTGDATGARYSSGSTGNYTRNASSTSSSNGSSSYTRSTSSSSSSSYSRSSSSYSGGSSGGGYSGGASRSSSSSGGGGGGRR